MRSLHLVSSLSCASRLSLFLRWTRSFLDGLHGGLRLPGAREEMSQSPLALFVRFRSFISPCLGLGWSVGVCFFLLALGLFCEISVQTLLPLRRPRQPERPRLSQVFLDALDLTEVATECLQTVARCVFLPPGGNRGGLGQGRSPLFLLISLSL